MYPTKGSLTTTPLCLFSAADGHASSHMKPECGWRDAVGTVRVGTWLGEWRKIENAWAFDTWGSWQGGVPLFSQATGLRALTALGVPIIPTREGEDPVWHIANGAAFQLDWTHFSHMAPGGEKSYAHAHYEIRSAATGDLVRSGPVTALPLPQEALPGGSYVAYVQYRGITEGLRLPTGYGRDAAYDYTTGDNRTSHYNPHKFVGEVPADFEHPLNVLRRELIASNAQEDVPEYSPYVTSEAAQNGEGSAIKLHVGFGSWEVGDGIFVTPSRALCELDFNAPATLPEGGSPSTPVPIAFDPLAHVVSQVLHTRRDGIWGGKVLLGGARFSPDGARPTLWQWNEDNTATLLGSAPQACSIVCEELLSTGLVTALTELDSGEIILLTLCSRHRYDASGLLPENRLPRYPLSSDGEPGGRSMTSISGTRVFHTTEALFRDPDPETEVFYNITIDIQGEKVVQAGGTIANVDGCLWLHRGKTMGVRVAMSDGKTYLSTYDGKWRGLTAFRTERLALQRGASVNGMNLAFGYVPNTQTARAIRDNGRRVQVLECDYRLREATLTNHATSPHLQTLIAPARKVEGAELSAKLSNAWSLIELDGSHDGDGGDPPPDDPLDPPVEGDDRKWRVLQLPAHQPIHALQIRDCHPEQAFLAANADPQETRIGVRLRVDSDAAPDDFSSYIWRPQLDRSFALPIAATSKVEMLIVTRAELAPEQLPVWGAEA